MQDSAGLPCIFSQLRRAQKCHIPEHFLTKNVIRTAPSPKNPRYWAMVDLHLSILMKRIHVWEEFNKIWGDACARSAKCH
jgi:hypothetical protein